MTKKMNAAEKAAYREKKRNEAEAYKAKMLEGIANFCRSDAYKEYLNIMARFPSYSTHNLLMIMMQKPDASLVQGFTAWKKMGRSVRKGEKGIRIWAPQFSSRKADENEEEDNDDKLVLRGFRLVSVFDVAQTEGEVLPDICSSLSGAVSNLDDIREALISHYGVEVYYEDPGKMHGAKGVCYPNDAKIGICSGLEQAQELKTLIHELAHFLLHAGENGKLPTDTKELQAESVAYVVCQHIGLDTGEYSFGYIASWGEARTAKEIMDALKPVAKTAAGIMEVLDGACAEAEEAA